MLLAENMLIKLLPLSVTCPARMDCGRRAGKWREGLFFCKLAFRQFINIQNADVNVCFEIATQRLRGAMLSWGWRLEEAAGASSLPSAGNFLLCRMLWPSPAKADLGCLQQSTSRKRNQFILITKIIYLSLCAATEKAMAPHSSTLAWKIPWTEEPGRLQSMGSRRVGHD